MEPGFLGPAAHRRLVMALRRLACVAVVAAITVSSFAHAPGHEGNADYRDAPAAAIAVADMELSLAFYAWLELGGDVDVCTFEGKEGQRIPWC